jgi:transcription elongation factor Elf1
MNKKIAKLTIKELHEPLFTTWGRIRSRAKHLKNKRLIALIEKLDKDLRNAKVEESYFKTRETIICPICYKSKLSEVSNKNGDVIMQRVVNCDRCGWVYSFDAPPNWEKILKDNLNYLNFSVKEGCLDAEEALSTVKERDWGSIDKMRRQA